MEFEQPSRLDSRVGLSPSAERRHAHEALPALPDGSCSWPRRVAPLSANVLRSAVQAYWKTQRWRVESSLLRARVAQDPRAAARRRCPQAALPARSRGTRANRRAEPRLGNVLVLE